MVALLKFIVWLSSALPLRWARAWGAGCGALFRVLGGRQRKRAAEQMARSLPGKSDAAYRQLIRDVYRTMGVGQIEVLRWIGGRHEELAAQISVEGLEHLEAARARGRGVLVLTAHIGNWDVLGLWAAAKHPLTIISKELRNRDLNRFWMEARARCGLKIVPAHNSYRDCLRVLKRGELLGFILDQNMTRDEGIFVEFFGRPACTTPGLAMLSAHAQAPVLPAFLVRNADDTMTLKLLPPLDPPPDRQPETLKQATQAYTKVVEQIIRHHPGQWIWMHRRWRTQPPGGATGSNVA
jgi:KDO2-lipid IV(A) lauroyltransferase